MPSLLRFSTDDKSRFRHCEPAKQSSDKQSIILLFGLLHSVRNDGTSNLNYRYIYKVFNYAMYLHLQSVGDFRHRKVRLINWKP